MISLGLSGPELREFHAALVGPHTVKITVQVLDLQHNYVADLSRLLVDGQVNVDADAEVTRTATVTFLDAKHQVQFDSNAPGDGAMYLDRMLRIVYSVNAANLSKWVDVPIFCGPVTKMNRADDLVTVECSGKEALLMDALWVPRSYQKGHTKGGLLVALCDAVGETKRTFDDVGKQKTTKAFSLVRESVVWSAMKAVAGPLGAVNQLFYDGRGRLRFRKTPTKSTFTYATGDGGSITSYPQITYDAGTVKNTVLVKGATPKGAKAASEWGFGVSAAMPFSAARLGRNGKPRYLVEVIEDTTVKTKAQAQALADARFDSMQRESIDVAFDALVIPHLEPLDIVTVRTDDFALTIRYKQTSIPLLGEPVASVGYTMRKTAARTRIRRKR